MANQQSSKRQGERESTSMTRSEGERGLSTRQYQDPFSLFDSLFERMQRDFFGTSLFNALLPSRGETGQGGGSVRVPRVQMRDTGNAIELTAELPGIDPDDLRVELEGDVLTISGESQSEQETDGGRTERYSSFYRQLGLPENVDPDQCESSYKHGVLSLKFPKRQQRTNTRQIPINTSASGTGQGGSGQSGQPSTAKQGSDRAA
jgi:HSP20 family protein